MPGPRPLKELRLHKSGNCDNDVTCSGETIHCQDGEYCACPIDPNTALHQSCRVPLCQPFSTRKPGNKVPDCYVVNRVNNTQIILECKCNIKRTLNDMLEVYKFYNDIQAKFSNITLQGRKMVAVPDEFRKGLQEKLEVRFKANWNIVECSKVPCRLCSLCS